MAQGHSRARRPPRRTRYTPRVGGKKAGEIWKEWCDTILFANWDEVVKSDDTRNEEGFKRGKAFGAGGRIIHTQRRSAWDAKCRHAGVPMVLPLSFEDYAAARDSGPSASELAKEYDELFAQLEPDADLASKFTGYVGDRTNANRLAQACDRIRTMISQKEETTDA